jgi:plasmid replication initiation protein
MGKTFHVTNVEGGQNRATEYHIIRTVNYLLEGEQGGENQEYIDITIEPEMKPLLLQLGNNYQGVKGETFTAYDMRNIKHLGVYHIRIYELLKQYEKIGNRKIGVEEIKRLFELENEYKNFGGIEQKVIKPSIKAINKHTDLVIYDVEKIKEGRRITTLNFKFRAKTKEEEKQARGEGVQQKLEFTAASIEEATLEPTEQDRLFDLYNEKLQTSFGVTPSMFMQTLKDNPSINIESIEKAMRVTRRMNINNEITKSVGGYFITALKKNYTDEKEEAKKRKKEREERGLIIKEKLLKLETEREKEKNDRIRLLVEEDKELTQKAIESIKQVEAKKILILKKEKELGRELELEDYRNSKILRGFLKGEIIELKKERFKDIFKKFDKKSKELLKS